MSHCDKPGDVVGEFEEVGEDVVVGKRCVFSFTLYREVKNSGGSEGQLESYFTYVPPRPTRDRSGSGK